MSGLPVLLDGIGFGEGPRLARRPTLVLRLPPALGVERRRRRRPSDRAHDRRVAERTGVVARRSSPGGRDGVAPGAPRRTRRQRWSRTPTCRRSPPATATTWSSPPTAPRTWATSASTSPPANRAGPPCSHGVAPDGAVSAAADGLEFPNGTVITPDGRTLIVGETMAKRVTAFTIADDGTLSRPAGVGRVRRRAARRVHPRRRRRDLVRRRREQRRGAGARGR